MRLFFINLVELLLLGHVWICLAIAATGGVGRFVEPMGTHPINSASYKTFLTYQSFNNTSTSMALPKRLWLYLK